MDLSIPVAHMFPKKAAQDILTELYVKFLLLLIKGSFHSFPKNKILFIYVKYLG